MRRPHISLTLAGLTAAFDVVAKHITVLERRGEKDTLAPTRLALPTAVDGEPDGPLVKWDSENKQIGVYDKSQSKWLYVTLS